MDRIKISQLAGAVFAFFVCLLAACDSTGGAIGNLVPAPKFLKGKIANGVYTSADGYFSVKVPHKEGSEEFRYMRVKEQVAAIGLYLSFGPAALNQDIFRIDIGKRLTPESRLMTIETFGPALIAKYRETLMGAYRGDLRLIESHPETINGHPAVYFHFEQTAKAGTYATMQVELRHDVYILDFGKAGASVWVQAPQIQAEGADLTPREFAESLVIH
jgi:hypothetical protein